MNGLDNTSNSTALERGSDDLLALDAEDVEAVSSPVVGHIGEHNNEANCGNNVGDPGVDVGGNSTLDWWEDGTARDTHL